MKLHPSYMIEFTTIYRCGREKDPSSTYHIGPYFDQGENLDQAMDNRPVFPWPISGPTPYCMILEPLPRWIRNITLRLIPSFKITIQRRFTGVFGDDL
jgi:hypothetical protein